MTGYNQIRNMSDEELKQYFLKFAKHYYHEGFMDRHMKLDMLYEIKLIREIGEHSNFI